MPYRPACVAFDMVETTFSLEKLRPVLVDAGLAPHMLETWFAGLLRDAFALDTLGQFTSFPDMATSSLGALGVTEARIDDVLGAFATLDAHPDAAPAMAHLRDAGIDVIALTNGSAELTRTILTRNDLIGHVSRVISINEIGRWKPAGPVYQYAAQAVGVAPDRMALIAAHPWDCAGAAAVGYATGFVSRDGAGWPSAMRVPDITATSLTDLAQGMASWDTA